MPIDHSDDFDRLQATMRHLKYILAATLHRRLDGIEERRLTPDETDEILAALLLFQVALDGFARAIVGTLTVGELIGRFRRSSVPPEGGH